MAGILFDGSVRFDDTFVDSLARMIDEEPIQQRDGDWLEIHERGRSTRSRCSIKAGR
jgi:hypothetical protein